MRKAFAQLQPLDRDVLTLCVIKELSIREAATALDTAEGSVKSRLHRAKARLGNLYTELEDTRGLKPITLGRTTP